MYLNLQSAGLKQKLYVICQQWMIAVWVGNYVGAGVTMVGGYCQSLILFMLHRSAN
jgi:hypothetical protein